MIRNPRKGLTTLWFDEDEPYDDDGTLQDFLIEEDEFRI
jgi:hypothetical protein